MKKSILIASILLVAHLSLEGICLKTYSYLKDETYPVFELWNKGDSAKGSSAIRYTIGQNLEDVILQLPDKLYGQQRLIGWTMKGNRNTNPDNKKSIELESSLNLSKPLYISINRRYYKIIPGAKKSIYLSFDDSKSKKLYPQTGPSILGIKKLGQFGYTESCLDNSNNIKEQDITDITDQVSKIKDNKSQKQLKQDLEQAEKMSKGQGSCIDNFNFLLRYTENKPLGLYERHAADLVFKLIQGKKFFIEKCAPKCKAKLDAVLDKSDLIGVQRLSVMEGYDPEMLQNAQESIKKSKQDFLQNCLKPVTQSKSTSEQKKAATKK